MGPPPADGQKLLFDLRKRGIVLLDQVDRAFEISRPFDPVGPAEFGEFLRRELDILLFRRQELGHLVQHGGDLDNRLKTLLDALRMPTAQEIPPGDAPGAGEQPFHCLLEDDALVSKVSVETERWLENAPDGHVALVISVVARPTLGTINNISLLG